jgi:hypothetical protein
MDEFKQEFRFEDGVMHVLLAGKFPMERMRKKENLFRPLIVACQEQNCRKALVDARELEAEFDTTALFRAGVDASDLNRYGLRVALLAREEMISLFFDDVIRNRAAQVQVFTDVGAEGAWLNAAASADIGADI